MAALRAMGTKAGGAEREAEDVARRQRDRVGANSVPIWCNCTSPQSSVCQHGDIRHVQERDVGVEDD